MKNQNALGRPAVNGSSNVRRPALFLDRDGVINVERDYVHRIEDFEFVDGVFCLAREAVCRDLLLVVVTNQSGIGRGYYTEADFERLMAWVRAEFARRGAEIAAVYHCPFHPTAGVGRYRADSPDRKPQPGMLLRAARDLGIDLGRSIMVGDRASDMLAAEAAGIGQRILLENDRSDDLARARAHRVVRRLDEVFASARSTETPPP